MSLSTIRIPQDGNPVTDVQYHTVHGVPNCSFYALTPSASDDHFLITTSGRLEFLDIQDILSCHQTLLY